MPKVKVGDVNMYYEFHGEGEPLLLIMGSASTTAAWGPTIPILSREYKVIAFDNRGIGYSESPDVPMTYKTMADDAAGLLDALGIDSAHVFGVSMGGGIAQHFALDHSEKVVSLILGCTSSGSSSETPVPDETWAVTKQVEGMSQEDFAKMMPVMLYPPEFIENNPKAVQDLIGLVMEKPIPSWVITRHVEAAMAHDTYDWLPQIKAPTLVVGGEKDIMLGAEHFKALASRIPNAEVVIWEDLGHGFWLQKTQETMNVVLDFLRRHPKK